ncbi:11679_t:CDS:2 [Diversispora eburnea]|uniref:11679_t:CDS:1 n=1 Tax=Diversispora eburnea TaxID=1213867 RepID=A0A9N9FWX0_9GLOM|nr:11679_t:CDS:2 [Diversispora eburnea]
MIRSSLNLMVLIIAWIKIFSLTSSVFGLGIFTHNETNSFPAPRRIWQHGEYIDGTVVLRMISGDLNKTSTTGTWTRPLLSLRIIHPNGTVNEIDKDLGIQDFNWLIFEIPGVDANQDPISVDALHRGYLIVRYFKASNTTDFTTYEECGRIIDWYGNLYRNDIWYTSNTAIITNVDPSKGFIRTAAENATYVEWQQYMIDDSFNLIKLSEGNITLPMEDGAFAIFNTVATVDEGYSIIMGNSTSKSANPDDPLEIQAAVYDLKIGYNETQFSAPKLLYQSHLPNITIYQMFCSISSTGVGQVCLLDVRQSITQNNDTQSNVTSTSYNDYYVKLDFLISGSVTKITSLHILPELPSNTTTGWQVKSIPFGGYLFYGYFLDAKSRTYSYGYYYNEIENKFYVWDFSEPTVLNLRGVLLILPNNTLLVSQRENNDTWSFLTTDIPNYSGFSDNGYSNALINSTSPKINAIISNPSKFMDTGSITISYYEPVELSDGYIWIYRIDNNVTRQFVVGNNDKFCSISDNGLTVIVKVIESTFSYPNSQYYVKVDNNFVRSKKYGEPLMGIDDNIWKFNTYSSEETFASTASGIMRLTEEGTNHYYLLTSSEKSDFFSNLIIELSKILSIDYKRLSSNEKFQVDNTIKPNTQILINLRIQSSRTERSVKFIIEDLHNMIKHKSITAISLFPNTNYLDEAYGFKQQQNLWNEYWIRFMGVILSFGVLICLFALAWKKDIKKEGRNVAILQLGIIIFDFVMDTLFVTYNSTIVKELYIPSWAFYIISEESKSEKFMQWSIRYGRVVSIFTVLSGADIEALSIIYSTLAGFEILNAPFSNKGKSRIFWCSWLNIFLEDIPQVIIQILYFRNVVSYDIIPILTLTSQCLNLLINVIGRLFQTINFYRHGLQIFERTNERTNEKIETSKP